MTEKLTMGQYRVQEGDTANSIAVKLYGDVHRAPEITAENGTDWDEGDIIEIPGFTGFELIVNEGEQFTRLYARAFGNTVAAGSAKDEFFKWNGRAELHSGDTAFFVDVRRKSYGY